MSILKSSRARRTYSRSGVRHAAYVRPRALLGVMGCLLVASTVWAAAAGNGAAKTTPPVGKPMHLADLPSLIADYGHRRALAALSASSGVTARGLVAGASSVQPRKFSLTEIDLTPNSPSDERQAAYSPDGDLIAFSSNGADSNKADANGSLSLNSKNANGRFHLWVMSRQGKNLTQVTGLGTNPDANTDQTHPAWSPDGNRLVYLSNDSAGVPQLFVVQPFDANPVPQQRTFIAGTKQGPAWSPDGTNIAFASNTQVDPASGKVLSSGQYDIYTIASSGDTTTLQRLTGGTADPIGNTADDMSPAYGVVSNSVIFFSSNRVQDNKGVQSVIIAGRRIWAMSAGGSDMRQITDPTQRPNGKATDIDDNPAPSASGDDGTGFFSERVAFQSNSLIDASDKTPDLNIWSITYNSTGVGNAIPTPKPALDVSDFGDLFDGTPGRVVAFDKNTGATQGDFVSSNSGLVEAEGLVYSKIGGFDFFKDPSDSGPAYPDLFVANRGSTYTPPGSQTGVGGTTVNGAGEVDLFDGKTGTFVRTFAPGGDTTKGFFTNPTGVCFDDFGNFYVASGSSQTAANGATPTSSFCVHRFEGDNSTGLDNKTANPLPATDPATKLPRLGSEFTSGKGVNPTPNGVGSTNGLEGITFGPDVNGDGVKDLYVCVLNENKVNVYDGVNGELIGPTGNNMDFTSGFVQPGAGNLSGPTGLTFDPTMTDLYVCSSGTNEVDEYSAADGSFVKHFVTSTQGLSDPQGLTFGLDGNLYVSSAGNSFVCRFNGATGASLPAKGQTGSHFSPSGGISQPTYLAFNPSDQLSPTIPSIAENAGSSPAVLETNSLSSPNGFIASQLAGSNATEDKAPDQEPTFGRNASGVALLAQLAFSSQRLSTPYPNAVTTGPSPSPNNPIVVNPTGSFDIWTTQSQDFTPPALVPQGAGNQTTPVLAPGPQSPFFAPRTAEEGLTTNSTVTVGFVLKETESGLNDSTGKSNVFITINNADADLAADNNYDKFDTPADNSIKIRYFEELSTVESNRGSTKYPVTCWDDGPVSAGGHEQQAGAVAGDGLYYCQASVPTPLTAGDFYITINVSDQAGNGFDYDNVWGFSTKRFARSAGKTDLLVSDIACGQQFPQLLDVTGRFDSMLPVESYLLTNNSDLYLTPTGGTVADEFPAGLSIKTTLPTVDIWRVLCRGEVPAEVLTAYSPTVTKIYDPSLFTNGRPADPLPTKTLSTVVSNSAVVWADPYAATSFSGPGSLYDSEMQRRLSDYLAGGGRLFIFGRDIIYALTNGGTTNNNTFLTNELQASWNGEVGTAGTTMTNDAGFFPSNVTIDRDQKPHNILQIPTLIGDPNNTYLDGADNQFLVSGADVIGTVPAAGSNPTVVPAYSEGSSVVGQRIENTRSGAIASKVVFFSFGFEAINRYWVTDSVGPFCANVRFGIGDEVLKYLKTTGVSGHVIDQSTNLPVDNYILRIDGTGKGTGLPEHYIAITDATGAYDVQGMVPGTYTVSHTASDGKTLLNPLYISQDAVGVIEEGGTPVQNVDFRVIPLPKGSISGTALLSEFTAVTSDDQPLPGIPILIRSVDNLSVVAGGGHYADIQHTDAAGAFAFAGVPSGAAMQLIFNPTVDEIPVESNKRDGYAGPLSGVGHRIIPDSKRSDTIEALAGTPFVLNDVTPDTPADDGEHIVIPEGVSVQGHVENNNNGAITAIQGATVELQTPSTTPGGDPVTVDTATTDSKGFYSLDDVKPNALTANPTTPYTVTSKVNGQTASTTVLVKQTAANTVTASDLVFFQQGLSGAVTVTFNGKVYKLPGIKVDATLSPTTTPTASTVTDANGKYSFPTIATGTYSITATAVETPGTATGTITNVVVVSGKSTVAPTISLQLQGITGLVGLNNKVFGGATVNLYKGTAATGTPLKSTVSASNGSYGFGDLDAGTYTLQAQTTGDTSAAVQVVVKPGVSTTARNLLLYFESIKGTVLLNSGGTATPAATATVKLYAGKTTAAPLVQTFTADPSGNYTFSNLVAGYYTLQATGSGDRSATVSGQIRRGSGTTTAPIINLYLRSVSGTVTTNNVVTAGATVSIIGTTALGASYTAPDVTSASDGTYSFSGLTAGTYKLRAVKGSLRADLTLNVARTADRTNIALPLITENLTGHVTLAEPSNNTVATPTGNLIVALVGSNGKTLATTLTSADGSYGFGALPPGNYVIDAGTSASGGDTRRVNATVVAGKVTVVPPIKLVLQAISGTVTAAGFPVAGATVARYVQKGTAIAPNPVDVQISDSNGNYTFNNVVNGTYEIEATHAPAVDKADATVTVARDGTATTGINLAVDNNIHGVVTLDGVPIGGATVLVTQGANSFKTTTDSNGNYQLYAKLTAGTFSIMASSGAHTATVTITIASADITVPTIALSSAPPTPSPSPTATAPPTATPTPTPTATPTPEDFQAGTLYQISVPFADSTANSTTTVAKAFDVPPTETDNGVKVTNYTLQSWDATQQAFVSLTATSTIARGQGYFIQPVARGVSIVKPATDASRKPLSAATLTILLHRQASNTSSDNGYNLIGFPFDPAKYASIDWLSSTVDGPDGRHYASIQAAAAAGIITTELKTLSTGSSTSYDDVTTLLPYKGYYVHDIVEGAKLNLTGVPITSP